MKKKNQKNCEHKNRFGNDEQEVCLDCGKSVWSIDHDIEVEKKQHVNRF